MAFEGFKQGAANFLATKESGTSGFHQFLKLEKVFKDAQRLSESKQLENARNRQSEQSIATQKINSAEKIASASQDAKLNLADIKIQFNNLRSIGQIQQKASQLANQQLNRNAFQDFDPDSEQKFVELRRQFAIQGFAALGIDPRGAFGLTSADIPGLGGDTQFSQQSIDQQINALDNLSSTEIADINF